MFRKIAFILSICFFITLTSCSDNKYCFKTSKDEGGKVFCFEENFKLKRNTLDSIVNLSLINSNRKLKNTSTFEVKDLKISLNQLKDTSILTINGMTQIKNPSQLKIDLSYSGKNAFGVASNFYDTYFYLLEDNKLVSLQPISVKLNIEEIINEKPEFSFEHKHTIDSVIYIDWHNSNYTIIHTHRSVYGNEKVNLAISKNNVEKALNILKTKNSVYKMERDILDDKSFGLSCGIYDSYGLYSYNDWYFNIEARDKEELITKLDFINKFVYTNSLKHNEWKVIKKNGRSQETYNK